MVAITIIQQNVLPEELLYFPQY